MLAYDQKGTGRPLVLLHAFPLAGGMWDVDRDRFAASHRVIAPDLPGFGRSPVQETPSIPGMARDVLALLDALQVREPVIVGGLSMGGYVALEMLRQAPQRVRALGLWSTRATADTPEQREGRFKLVDRIRAEGFGAVVPTLVPRLLGATTLTSRLPVVERVQALARANADAGVINAVLAMAQRADSTDVVATLRLPTLVVAGEEDTFIPVAESEQLHRHIPASEFAVIRAAGHLVSVEQPERFHEALSRWLGRSR